MRDFFDRTVYLLFGVVVLLVGGWLLFKIVHFEKQVNVNFYFPARVEASNVVHFSDLTKEAVAWSWDFGDGIGKASSQNPEYIYSSPGSFIVRLTVNNKYKGSNTIIVEPKQIAVSGTVAVKASCSTRNAKVNQEIQFIDKTPNATSRTWDFDEDNHQSTEKEPAYSYKHAGAKMVHLTVSGPGFTADTSLFINVLSREHTGGEGGGVGGGGGGEDTHPVKDIEWQNTLIKTIREEDGAKFKLLCDQLNQYIPDKEIPVVKLPSQMKKSYHDFLRDAFKNKYKITYTHLYWKGNKIIQINVKFDN